MEITKAQLQAAINKTEINHEIELREDYSGRGMYGEEAWGVVGSVTALDEFEGNLAAYMLTEDPYFNPVSAFDLLNIMVDIQDERQVDSMGLEAIYYYPRIELVKED